MNVCISFEYFSSVIFGDNFKRYLNIVKFCSISDVELVKITKSRIEIRQQNI